MEEATPTPAAEAVESGAPGTTDTASVTDGGTTQETTATATPDAGTADETATAASEESNEARNDRRQRQREARKQPTPTPAPAKTPEQIIAEHEATQKAAREAAERQQREQERFAKWIGDDRVNPNDPNSPTRYQQLWNEANTPIPDGDDKFFTDETRALVQKVNQARAQLAELNERRGMLSEVYTPAQQAAQMQARDWLGNELERGLAEIGLDPQQVIAGIRDPNVAIPTIVRQIAEAKDAEYKPRIEELEGDLAAEREENDSLRRQLGGTAAQPLRGGSVAGVGGTVYTRARLAAMLNSPEGLREYRQNYAEIQRQEAAGLIR